MADIPWRELDASKRQDLVDLIYSQYGLPFEGETTNALWTRILPFLFVDETVVFATNDPGLPLYERVCRFADYVIHEPFHLEHSYKIPWDPRAKRSFVGIYRRKPEATQGAEFLHVLIHGFIEVASDGLCLALVHHTSPARRREAATQTRDFPFSYWIDDLSWMAHALGLRLVATPSEPAREARRKRFRRHIAQRLANQKRMCEVLGEMSRSRMSYQIACQQFGEDMMRGLTWDEARPGDWITARSMDEDTPGMYYVTIYRPDGHGGLRRIQICEICPLPDEVLAAETDEKLTKWLLERRP